MTRTTLLIIIALLTLACEKSTNQLESILRLEDRRVACDSLINFIYNPDPKIRARTVEALGKLQDPSCLALPLKMLDDSNPEVRLEAAFALGQLGDVKAEEELIDRLAVEESIPVRIRIVEALGKLGTKSAFPTLMRLFNSQDSKLKQATVLASARLAMRDLTDAALTKALVLLLQDRDVEVRWTACFALLQIGDLQTANALRKATHDKDSRVRIYAAQALGKLQDVPSLERFGSMLRNDEDWRVRVEVANALGNYPLRKVANYFSLLNQPVQVSQSILRAIGMSGLQEPERKFLQNSREHNLAKHLLEQVLTFEHLDNGHGENDEMQSKLRTPAEIGAALLSYAQLLEPKAIDLISRFAGHSSASVRVRAMQALGETNSLRVIKILEDNYRDAPQAVKIAIISAFTKIGYLTNPRLLLNALQEQDHVLVALAANGLALDTENNKAHLGPIINSYKNLPKPIDIESAQIIFDAMARIGDSRAVPILKEAMATTDQARSRAAAEALRRITGEDFSAAIPTFTSSHSNFDHDDIASLRGAEAFIKTSRGNIEIKLFPEEAPLTVLNFVRLAEKGFYDRLTFHRVVPNFVTQAGDPRGDSWGSPGYRIRSEFNKHPYVRGTVGMANAGKDTEGSQFFITHAEQPQLEGLYTVFGQVTDGMEVVDAVQEGDLMQLVSIKR